MNYGGIRCWPFVDEPTVAAAFARIAKEQPSLRDITTRQSAFELGFKRNAQYTLRVYTEAPPTVDPETGMPPLKNTAKPGWLFFGDTAQRDLALVMLAGRWGYLWWLMFGDEFNVTKGVLEAFPSGIGRSGLGSDQSAVQPNASDTGLMEDLLRLSIDLQRQMPHHVAWKLNRGLMVGRYNMLKLQYLTDEADLLLARLWRIENAYEAAGNLRDRTVFGNMD